MNVVTQLKEADLTEVRQSKIRKTTVMRSTFQYSCLLCYKLKACNENYLK